MEIISSIEKLYGVYKKLNEVSERLHDADLKLLLADLKNDLADAKSETADLKIALANSKDKIRELEETIKKSGEEKPEYDGLAYSFQEISGLIARFVGTSIKDAQLLIYLTIQNTELAAFVEFVKELFSHTQVR